MVTFVERRRTPRTPPAAPCAVELTLTASTRVVDVSDTGMLLICPSAFPIGTRGRFRTVLGTRRFEAEVEIQRGQTAPQTEVKRQGYALGVAFRSAGPEAQQVLKELLKTGRLSEELGDEG